jgi:hypothetical protein
MSAFPVFQDGEGWGCDDALEGRDLLHESECMYAWAVVMALERVETV